jgi:Flp pilus assembly protein TadB
MLFKSARQVIIFVVGSIVVLVGIAGIVLPLIPAVVVIPAGLAILATEFIWARRLLKELKRRAQQAGNMVGIGRAATQASGGDSKPGGDRAAPG